MTKKPARTAIIVIGSVGSLIAVGLMVLYLVNLVYVKSHIRDAQEKYGGAPEEALLFYLDDESRSPYTRTHGAIWTLGQIKSEKALPRLKALYRNDPDGESCYENHDSLLCQYEIHKAIVRIENGGLFSYNRLK
jgi:hypothetical protein